MLHTFFFVMSFLTDRSGIANAFRNESTLGFLGACVVSVALAVQMIRSWRTRQVR